MLNVSYQHKADKVEKIQDKEDQDTTVATVVSLPYVFRIAH